MLNENADYLGRLGQNVTSVDELWNFEVQQAYGLPVVTRLDSVIDAAMDSPGISLEFARAFSPDLQARYALGSLGQGWYTPWQSRLVLESGDKLARVIEQGGTSHTYLRDSRTQAFAALSGDSSTLEAVAGGLYQQRTVDGQLTRFRADGQIDFVRDANGNQITASYDGSGRLIGLTHSSGANLTLAYNPGGRISTITDSANRTTTYGYDATNTYLTTVTAPDGQVTTYTYETTGSPQRQHSLLSISRGGSTQFFTYDQRGRLDTSYRTGNVELIDYVYTPSGQVSVADALGTSSIYFDQFGQAGKLVDALGNITTNQFDNQRRLISVTSSTGERQSFTWTTRGSLASATDELGNVTRLTYDNALARLTSLIDPRGQTTSFAYDAKGNLLTTTYPNGSWEGFSNYTSAGSAQTSVNRRGQAVSLTYDAAGRVTQQTLADNSVVNYAYDARGNLTTITDGTKITTYTYNFATDGDRLKRVTYPGGRYLDYQYDAFGRRSRMTDQTGYETRYEYDTAGRLATLKDATDAVLVAISTRPAAD